MPSDKPVPQTTDEELRARVVSLVQGAYELGRECGRDETLAAIISLEPARNGHKQSQWSHEELRALVAGLLAGHSMDAAAALVGVGCETARKKAREIGWAA
jgi:hypothetical protein